ncbi:Uncharacterised protein [uncultured archaeon]|nr:Uncharacterised protein [uncultured archaeon]
MIVVLCEGNLDMEFLSFLFESKSFNKINHDENCLLRKLGLDYKKYKVLEKNDDELIIFFPKSGGYDPVLNTAKDGGTQIDWIRRGVTKVVIAVDLDDKNVDDRIAAIEGSLSGVYEVNRINKFSYNCRYNEKYEFLFIIIPVGDSTLQEKIDVVQEKSMIEDLILNLALTKSEYENILKQSIELYKHKMGKRPDQKALLRMMESFCNDPEKGSYQIISELKDNINTILPEHIEQSIIEILSQEKRF